MPAWEYLLVQAEKNTHNGEWEIEKFNAQHISGYPPPVLYDYLNQKGSEGWELISDSITGTQRELIFKRSKR